MGRRFGMSSGESYRNNDEVGGGVNVLVGNAIACATSKDATRKMNKLHIFIAVIITTPPGFFNKLVASTTRERRNNNHLPGGTASRHLSRRSKKIEKNRTIPGILACSNDGLASCLDGSSGATGTFGIPTYRGNERRFVATMGTLRCGDAVDGVKDAADEVPSRRGAEEKGARIHE